MKNIFPRKLSSVRPLLLIIFLIAILFLISYGLKFNTNTEDTEAQYVESTNLVLKFENQGGNTVALKEVNATKGFVQKQSTMVNLEESRFVLNVKKNNEIIEILPIQFVDYVISEQESHLKGGDSSTKTDPRISLNEAYVSVGYSEGDVFEVLDKESGSVTRLDSGRINNSIASAKSIKRFPSKTATGNDFMETAEFNGNFPSSDTPIPNDNGFGDGYLDILYISSGYTDFGLFESDVSAMADLLLNTAPFSNAKSKIRISLLNNSEDLGCYLDGIKLYICDLDRVLSVASQINRDSIVVVINSDWYGGAGWLGANVATTYRDVDALAKEVMVHEFGHSFGGLFDEYDYGTEYLGDESSIAVNCDLSAQCKKWRGVPGTGCYDICSYTNLKRSVQDSIMRSVDMTGYWEFGPVSCSSLSKTLAMYTGKEVKCNNPLYTKQYFVKGSQVWYRDNQRGWIKWRNITNDFSSFGSGNITSFSSAFFSGDFRGDYVTKGGTVWSRTYDKAGCQGPLPMDGIGGCEQWTERITAEDVSAGNGIITGYSVYNNSQGVNTEYLVRGGKIWSRTFGSTGKWKNITTSFSSIGSGSISNYIKVYNPDEYTMEYLVRGNSLWRRKSVNGKGVWKNVTDSFAKTGNGRINSFSSSYYERGLE